MKAENKNKKKKKKKKKKKLNWIIVKNGGEETKTFIYVYLIIGFSWQDSKYNADTL